MGAVLTIAQQKGGAGKTSLAIHLATCWASQSDTEASGFVLKPKRRKSARAASGPRIALFDLDPQQSLSAWFHLREELYGADERMVLHSSNGWRVASEVERARKESDLVIVDSPPHAEPTMRIGIRTADLVVVPLQLSPMDIWAAQPTMQMIRAEKRPALLVLNRVPSRARIAGTIAEALKREQLPIATAALGNRVAFSASLMSGRGVYETEPNSAAGEEIRSLTEEVMQRLKEWRGATN